MKTLVLGLVMLGLAMMVRADEESAKELAELNQKIEQLLKNAPTGAHGGKVVSPEIKALMDKRSGGIVVPKTNGNTVLLIDARGEKDGFLEGYAERFKGQFHIGVTTAVKEIGAEDDPFAVAQNSKTEKCPAVIIIVSREGNPVLATFPEDAIGIVNAAPLKMGDKSLYNDRLTKEVWRCLALSLGGFSTVAPNGKVVKSILSPVYKLSDLDGLKVSFLSPSQCNAVYEAMSEIGIQAARPVVYSVACRQGWAPTPTNAIQKAIWEKIKAEKSVKPSNPIKVNFDPKTAPKVGE